ncbi:Charged multivesicular body protein 4b [Aphelenchoides besseyi]|nr:Charged multivesicular body protein 4b [Aphelenchoides besseyi]
MFKNIFSGGRKKELVPTTQESLQKLRDTEDMLRKKQDFLEKKIETELVAAKRYGTANKRMALQALRRKQLCQKQLSQIDGVLSTLQNQQNSLENAAVNAEVLQVLGNTSKALKNAHNNMDIDQVHDLMEDIAEQQEVANEIAEAISNPIGFQTEDDDDLLAELEKLEEESLEKELLNVGPTPLDAGKLPSVPTTELPSKSKSKTKEEDELGELAAWAES